MYCEVKVTGGKCLPFMLPAYRLRPTPKHGGHSADRPTTPMRRQHDAPLLARIVCNVKHYCAVSNGLDCELPCCNANEELWSWRLYRSVVAGDDKQHKLYTSFAQTQTDRRIT